MPQLVGYSDPLHHHFVYLTDVDGDAYDGDRSEAVSYISSWSIEKSDEGAVRKQVDHHEDGFEMNYYTPSSSIENGPDQGGLEQVDNIQDASVTKTLDLAGLRCGHIPSVPVKHPALPVYSLRNLRRVSPSSVPRLTTMSHLSNNRIPEELRSLDLSTRTRLFKQRSTIHYLIYTSRFSWCHTPSGSEDCDRMTGPWAPLLKLKLTNRHTQTQLRGGGSHDFHETNDLEPSSTRSDHRVDSVSDRDSRTKNIQSDLDSSTPSNTHNISSPNPPSQDTDRVQSDEQNTPTTPSPSSQHSDPSTSRSAVSDYTKIKRVYPKPVARKTAPGQSNFTEHFDISGPAYFHDFAASLGVLPEPRPEPPEPDTSCRNEGKDVKDEEDGGKNAGGSESKTESESASESESEKEGK